MENVGQSAILAMYFLRMLYAKKHSKNLCGAIKSKFQLKTCAHKKFFLYKILFTSKSFPCIKDFPCIVDCRPNPHHLILQST